MLTAQLFRIRNEDRATVARVMTRTAPALTVEAQFADEERERVYNCVSVQVEAVWGSGNGALSGRLHAPPPNPTISNLQLQEEGRGRST